MSLSIVSSQLNQWASSAALKAVRANDPDSILLMTAASENFKRLAAIVQEAIEAESARRGPVRHPMERCRIARQRNGGRAAMSAFTFWRMHGVAVQAIIGVYGLSWKTRAPLGRTVLVSVPACWRSGKTERGGTVRWSRDHRMPGPGYWPNGAFPVGLEVSQDYPRAQPEDKPHDAAWHRAHGYTWNGSAWVHEVEIRSAQNRADAIEAYNKAKRLAGLENAAMWYGPQRSQDEILHQAHEQVWDGNFARETELMAAE